MLRRSLDVLHQYRRPILAVTLLVPVLLAAASLVFDRGELVTARIWAQSYVFLLDPAPTGMAFPKPAAAEARLLDDLLGTDSFADRVLAAGGTAFATSGPAVKARERARFRSGVQVRASGEHLVLISYRTTTPERAVKLLNSLIDAFGETAPAAQFGEAMARGSLSEAELRAARAAVNQTSSVFKPSALQPRATPSSPLSPQALLAQDSAAADRYRRVLAADSLQPEAVGADLPALRPAAFLVIDPPTRTVLGPGRALPVVGLGIAMVSGVVLMLTYLTAWLDPRIRTGADGAQHIGILYLGHVPRIGLRAP